MSTEFVNEYGTDQAESRRLRTMLIEDTRLLDCFVSADLRTWLLTQAGVVTIKMVSEILLHFSHIQDLTTKLVQRGILTLILDLQSALLN